MIVAEAPPSSLLPAFSPLTKPQKSMPKLETLADSFSDVDPFLDLDGDAALTGIRPDSLVPVHIPEGSEDTASLAQSAEPSFPDDAAFPLKGSHNYSCGTSSLTHSVSHAKTLRLLLSFILDAFPKALNLPFEPQMLFCWKIARFRY